MKGFERQIAVIASRQDLHRRIDALPDSAQILMITVNPTLVDGRQYDEGSMEVVGVSFPGLNERVLWLLQTAITYLMSGVGGRG